MDLLKFERDDLKPLEGLVRLAAIAGTGIFYVTTFQVSSFFPNFYIRLYNELADFDPGKAGTMGSGAAPRAVAPKAAEKPAAKAPARPAAKAAAPEES
ncbi:MULTISPECIES: hypothetical protein [Chloracidobacterium]|uniref:Uncharacterized protein n=1 Tax=Chloracidobacterium thermophilum (strain B) TaxID=981222 RepID=G2LLN2_CHLTF|nr:MULTISPECIES: hypothetical protein [Chloracidobacterium]AEP13828.1 hypothetical protein Cabther_B0831 [Chloracidobacterium thermophilum B]QUV80277.1 hypothetical protein J8C08_16130 [Chloracidobacterium thermophilum]QUV83192.1 hypothetical protein J8C01_14885 [Chloracidobacterium sp. D]